MGKPNGWVRFNDANVSRMLPGDFLQFELMPGIHRTLFGQPFVTNSHGMHSPEVALEKPPGTFRIAVLGASMDMGWGVTYQETYSHQLAGMAEPAWPAAGASTADRRFEVLNFAVAAYSPLQRLETFRRKAMAFQPDLVIYSATMLDLRLMEIHLCDALRNGADLTYDFLKAILDRAGIDPGNRTGRRRGQAGPQGADQGQAAVSLLGAVRRDARRAGRGMPVRRECRW